MAVCNDDTRRRVAQIARHVFVSAVARARHVVAVVVVFLGLISRAVSSLYEPQLIVVRQILARRNRLATLAHIVIIPAAQRLLFVEIQRARRVVEKGTCPGGERERQQPEITEVIARIENSFVKLDRFVAQTPLLFRFRAITRLRPRISRRYRHIGTSAHRHIGTMLAMRRRRVKRVVLYYSTQ